MNRLNRFESSWLSANFSFMYGVKALASKRRVMSPTLFAIGRKLTDITDITDSPQPAKGFACELALGCDRVEPGAKHTQSEASDLYVKEVFSRPEFMVLDVGNHPPQGRGHRFGDVLKPNVHPADLSNQRMVFVTPEGVKAMKPVIRLAHSRAVPLPTTGTTPNDAIQLHAQAENALSMAQFYIRTGNTAGARRKAVQALAAISQLSGRA